MPIRSSLMIFFLAGLLLSGCRLLPRHVKVGEEFTLKAGEKASVRGSDLSIQLKSVGRQWYVDRRAESPFAELIIKGRGAAPARQVTVGESVVVDDHIVRVTAANPFGNQPNAKIIVLAR